MGTRRPPEPPKSVNVLVVDDDGDAAEELSEFLGKANLDCKSACNGWTALEILAQGWRPQVVVTDIRMPELDGLELAQRFSRLSDDERPEIIFVSGHASFDDAVHAIRLGARDMLAKPIDGPRLVQAVKLALLARRIRQPAGDPGPASAEAFGPDPEAQRRSALRDLKRLRRARGQHLPAELFSDPCWEMLLDLYDAHLAKAKSTVTSLGAASGVPPTTALRRMHSLQEHGLITRGEDVNDKRVTLVQLTDLALRGIEKVIEGFASRSGGLLPGPVTGQW